MSGMVWVGVGGWVTRPPEHCSNGHRFVAGDMYAYFETWIGCWCSGSESGDAERPGHDVYTCRTCGDVTAVPECTDPALRLGWGASHGH